MYQLNTDEKGNVTSVLRLDDSAYIPIDAANSDYQAYLAWVSAGNVPASDPSYMPAEIVVSKWEQIKAERDRRKAGGVHVGSSWFHSDDSSRIQWLAMKDTARDVLAGGGTTASPVQVLGNQIQWKTLDGSFVPVTVQLVFDVVDATKALDAGLFTVAEQKRAALNASATPATFDVLGGWPKIYGE